MLTRLALLFLQGAGTAAVVVAGGYGKDVKRRRVIIGDQLIDATDREIASLLHATAPAGPEIAKTAEVAPKREIAAVASLNAAPRASSEVYRDEDDVEMLLMWG